MASAMAALLVAQIVGAFLIYRASADRLELSALTALTFQLSIGAEIPERGLPGARGAARRPGVGPPPEIDGPPLRGGAGLPRHLRYRRSAQPQVPLTPANTTSARAARLRELLAQEGLEPVTLAIELREAGSDPAMIAFAERRPRVAARSAWRQRTIYIASLQREPGAPWETARVFERQPPRQTLGLLLFQTVLIYAFLGTILFFVLRRITRPLALLTERVDDFSRAPDRAVRLEETGPSDARLLIAAHNAMEARIAALLDEKDVMLGAIGHDLKTPLAALRVRIESVPDEAQRARMADSIEDITRTLDDILSLARIGRANPEEFETVDITALAEGVVEEFEDLGEPVTIDLAEAGAARVVARVQVTWLKRALRNLVSNAVRYGASARVSVRRVQDRHGAGVVLSVEDDGPGIAPDRIAEMLEPFTRGDTSRNRSTGGAGLGLTLARAIAEAHGGGLKLANREEGGLRSTITLPG